MLQEMQICSHQAAAGELSLGTGTLQAFQSVPTPHTILALLILAFASVLDSCRASKAMPMRFCTLSNVPLEKTGAKLAFAEAANLASARANCNLSYDSNRLIGVRSQMSHYVKYIHKSHD